MFHGNYVPILYCEILVENRCLNLPYLYLVPPYGVILLEFYQDLRHQKTRVHSLSYGIVCIIVPFVHLAILAQCQIVTDGQAHTTKAYTALA